jgi:hypothetical protein
MIVFFLSSINLVGSIDLCLCVIVFNGIIFSLLSYFINEFFRASA